MCEMYERIALIRKTKGYNQNDFADALGLTKNFISLLETGRRDPSDRTIKDICREFNVNEEWLRKGTGEMFRTLDDEEMLFAWTGRVLAERPDSIKKRVMKLFMTLSDEEWELINRLAERMVQESLAAHKDTEQD